MLNERIANQTWNNFHWPEWVPEKIKKEIEEFHSDAWGRGPASWMEGAERNKSPLLGDRVRVHDFQGNLVIGRFIYAWNNVGRLLSDDGQIECVGYQLPHFEVSRNGMWKMPEPCDYFTMATCTFGSWEGSVL